MTKRTRLPLFLATLAATLLLFSQVDAANFLRGDTNQDGAVTLSLIHI